MIQYEVYKTPSPREEEPGHFHARAVSKRVITYDQLKKFGICFIINTGRRIRMLCSRKYPPLSQEGPRNSSIDVPTSGNFHTGAHTAHTE